MVFVASRLGSFGGRIAISHLRQPLPLSTPVCRLSSSRTTTCQRISWSSWFNSYNIHVGVRMKTTRQFSSKTKTEKATKEAASSSTSTTKIESTTAPSLSFSHFWKWYLGPKEMPPRWTLLWYREMVLICTVFAITGSSTMILVRQYILFVSVGCD
jgi:hypothetical protein